jgi:hypothetical protein
VSFTLPPVVKQAERLLVEIELAVRRFPRYHKYALGAAPQPPSAPSQSGVTDAMVQEARLAYNNFVMNAQLDIEALKQGGMRAALEAAFPQLQGELARLREDNSRRAQTIGELLVERDQLRDQLAALQAQGEDAKRYRWVRVQPNTDIGSAWILPVSAPVANTPEELDAAIDAAIAQEKD